MDSLTTAAARALAAGDPLGALNRVALREDADALALRGLAMAQLGELDRARVLLRRAARAFGPKEAVARARCVVAEAEIALVSRDLTWPERSLSAARVTLEEHQDLANATHARHLEARRLLLTGRIREAEQAIGAVEAARLPPPWRTAHELVTAGIALRRLRAEAAREALARARDLASQAGIPALTAEVERAALLLDAPVARLLAHGRERALLLKDVEALLGSAVLVVDACRHAVRDPTSEVTLATRPVLFALVRTLAEAWPGDAAREALIARAFRAKTIDDSHRARLRVEVGRLRAELREVADVRATKRGFALWPHQERDVVVLAPPLEGEHTEVLALLADGESWSSSALAIALASSPRTVQRALEALGGAGKVQALGRGRARRWVIASVPEFPTILLLPGLLPTS